MSLRSRLSESPLLVVSLLCICILMCGAYVWRSLAGPVSQGAAYYTADEGRTLHRDAPGIITPFTRSGKEYVRAHVLVCLTCKQQAGLYLERTTAAGLKHLGADKVASPADLEVRLPGASKWVGLTDPKALELVAISCPKDGAGNVIEANPQ